MLQQIAKQSLRRSTQDWLKHMKEFQLDLKFSAGLWFFSPSAGRFHDKYQPERSIEERLEVAASMQKDGLAALEVHYPSEISEENLDLYKAFVKDTGIRLVTIIPNLFYEAQFEWGSLSSPVKKERQVAIERLKTTLQLNVAFNTDFSVIWPGGDGYENPFGIDFLAMWDRFADGVAEAMDFVPGVRIAIEPKPYEPRGRIIPGTTAEALLMCQAIEQRLTKPANREILSSGEPLVAMNPEIGHMLMAYEDAPYAFSLILGQGRLAHTHWNSQPLGNYDQDLNVGVISPEVAEASLYVLKMHGYEGYFGLDINPERMDVTRALRNSIRALRAMYERVEELDHEAVLAAVTDPQAHRGDVESILLDARYGRK